MKDWEKDRDLLMLNKTFLKELWLGSKSQNYSSLLAAGDGQLKALLVVLFSIAAGTIPLREDKLNVLKKSHKFLLVRLHKKFQTKNRDLYLSRPRDFRVELQIYSEIYPMLLPNLFLKY